MLREQSRAWVTRVSGTRCAPAPKTCEIQEIFQLNFGVIIETEKFNTYKAQIINAIHEDTSNFVHPIHPNVNYKKYWKNILTTL